VGWGRDGVGVGGGLERLEGGKRGKGRWGGVGVGGGGGGGGEKMGGGVAWAEGERVRARWEEEKKGGRVSGGEGGRVGGGKKGEGGWWGVGKGGRWGCVEEGKNREVGSW